MEEIGRSNSPELTNRSSLPAGFWTLAGWLVWSMACLAIADTRLSASAGPGGMRATAIGLVIGLAALLPMLARSFAWISTLVVFPMLAAHGRAETWAGLQIGLQVALFALLLATIWAKLLRTARTRSALHLALLLWTFGIPAISYLAGDFGDGAGRISHLSIFRFLLATFSHT